MSENNLLRAENEYLKKENSELKQKYSELTNELQPVTNLFSRKGKGHGKLQNEMSTILVKSICQGESVPTILNFLTNLKLTFGSLFKDSKIPSPSYVAKLRSSVIPNIQSKFIQDFINESKYLNLYHDSTPSKKGIESLGLIIGNEKNQFAAITLCPQPQKTSQETAKLIVQSLKDHSGIHYETMIKKIRVLVSDRASSALLTSRLLLEELKKVSDSYKTIQTCLFHTCTNIERYAVESSFDGFENFLKNVAILFSERSNNPIETLRDHIKDVLPSKIKFMSRLGNRHFDWTMNSRLILHYHKEIILILQAHSQKQRARETLEFLTGDKLNLTLAMCGVISLTWTLFNKELMTESYKLLDQKEMEGLMVNLTERTQCFVNGDFNEMISLASLNFNEKSDLASSAISLFSNHLNNVSLTDRESLREIVQEIGTKVHRKIKKDFQETSERSEQNIPNDLVIPGNNIPCERLFSILKSQEDKFANKLSPMNQYGLVLSKYNNLANYCDSVQINELIPASVVVASAEMSSQSSECMEVYNQSKKRGRLTIMNNAEAKEALFRLFQENRDMIPTSNAKIKHHLQLCIEKLQVCFFKSENFLID